AGKMGRRRFHGDEEVHTHERRRQVVQGFWIKAPPQVNYWEWGCRYLLGARPDLHAYQLDPFQPSHAFERCQRQRAQPVTLILGATLPHDADLESLNGC